MAGLHKGTVYLSDQGSVPAGTTPNHKTLFTQADGVFVVDDLGNSVRLDDYKLIQSVSAALLTDISATAVYLQQGTVPVSNTNIYTISHVDVDTTKIFPVATLIAPDSSAVIYPIIITNRTTSSFDVVLSDTPYISGYSINWLLAAGGVATSISGGGGFIGGGNTSNPDVIGSGTVTISAQQSIVPTQAGVFSLGTSAMPWKELFVTGNTIYLGSTPISISGGSMSVGGSTLATASYVDSAIATGAGSYTTTTPGALSLGSSASYNVIHSADPNYSRHIQVWRDVHNNNVASTISCSNRSSFTEQSMYGTAKIPMGFTLYGPSAQNAVPFPVAIMGGYTLNTFPYEYTASDSYSYSTQYSWQLYDGNISTRWYNPNSPPQWCQMDMGADYVYPLYSYTISSTPGLQGSAPKTFAISGSLDGVNWTLLDTQTNISWASGDIKTFVIPTNHAPFRYFRLNTTAYGSDGILTFGELRFNLWLPAYTTSQMYYFTTNDSSHFITGPSVSKVNSVSHTIYQPQFTNVLMLVSFDGRGTWKYWNGSTWSATTSGLGSISTQGVAPSAITNGLANYIPGINDVALDFAWGLSTTSTSATPIVAGIAINYNEGTTWNAASIGAYDQYVTDASVKCLNSTTTQVRNNTPTTQNMLVSVFSP
jgi:hypothetical protein